MSNYSVDGGYIVLPVTVDPDQLTALALDTLASTFPGYVSREGTLDTLLLEQFAAMASESAQVASLVPLSIFQYFGTSLVNVPPIIGAEALIPTTWTMIDTKGYTVPAGTVIAYPLSGNESVLFATQADFTVPPGSTSTATGGVEVAATAVGVFANGLAGGPMTLVDSLAYVASVTSTAISSGGADPETLTAYLARLREQLQLLTPRPILASDFAALAQNIAGVGRALGLDNYWPGRTVTDGVLNATTTLTSATAAFTANDVGRTVTATGVPAGTTISSFTNSTTVVLSAAATVSATAVTVTFGALTNAERAVTVAVVDSSGNVVPTPVSTLVQTTLQAERETNFVVTVVGPTYTTVSVSYQGVVTAGSNTNTVETAVNQALTSYLSPASWGGGSQIPPAWDRTATAVRYLTIARVIEDVPGVNYLTSLQIGAPTLGTTDLTLTGPAPLTRVGTVSGVLTT